MKYNEKDSKEICINLNNRDIIVYKEELNQTPLNHAKPPLT